MLTYIILTGIVVFGFFFAAWLGRFLLNRSVNTELETDREERRDVAGQLGYGLLLLGITVALCVAFFQMGHKPVLPDMPPGLQPEAAQNATQTGDDSGWDVTLVLAGIGLSGFSFVLWLGIFLLNRSINTSPLSSGSARRSLPRQLGLGGFLLGLTITLCVVFSQMDRTALIPDVPSESAIQTIIQRQHKAAPKSTPAQKATGKPAPKEAPSAPAADSPKKAGTDTAKVLSI